MFSAVSASLGSSSKIRNHHATTLVSREASVMTSADRIVVLDDGHIRDFELVNRWDSYQRLFFGGA